MIALFLVLWATNTAGIGGGGTAIPVLVGFFRFNTKQAVYISNFSIFFSSIIRYLLNINQAHPLKNGKGLMVDYNLGILMLPLIVSGVSFGVLLNIVTPNAIVILLYIGGLAYFGYGLTKKAIQTY